MKKNTVESNNWNGAIFLLEGQIDWEGDLYQMCLGKNFDDSSTTDHGNELLGAVVISIECI